MGSLAAQLLDEGSPIRLRGSLYPGGNCMNEEIAGPAVQSRRCFGKTGRDRARSRPVPSAIVRGLVVPGGVGGFPRPPPPSAVNRPRAQEPEQFVSVSNWASSTSAAPGGSPSGGMLALVSPGSGAVCRGGGSQNGGP